MDPFLVTMNWIMGIGAILLIVTIFISRKTGRSSKWYGFLVNTLTSITLGIHFGLNLVNDLLGGLVIAAVFTLVLGLQWLGFYKLRERVHGNNN